MRKKKKNKPLKKGLKVGAIVGIVIGIVLLSAAYLTMTGSVIQSENVIEIIPQELTCQEFQEQVLWSSGYTSKTQGSIEYYVWYPKIPNCTSCTLHDIEIKTRFIYATEYNTTKTRESYVQISNSDNSICKTPEEGIYKKYLAYETLQDEEVKLDKYCNQNSKTKCEEEFIGDYGNALCYGIKTYASQYSIVDVFEIKYKWCKQDV